MTPPTHWSDGLRLVIDTSTRTSVVVGQGSGAPFVSLRAVGHRHGAGLLEQIDEVLAGLLAPVGEAPVGEAPVGSRIGVLGVGIGPGSFTGLRVGLATAKTICYVRQVPLVAFGSMDTLRLAAIDAGGGPDVCVVLPAGAHDHYLGMPGQAVMLVPPGELMSRLEGRPVAAIDLPGGVLPAASEEAALELGRACLSLFPACLLGRLEASVEAGRFEEPATLVPAYVALPRGISEAAAGMTWSPDLR